MNLIKTHNLMRPLSLYTLLYFDVVDTIQRYIVNIYMIKLKLDFGYKRIMIK